MASKVERSLTIAGPARGDTITDATQVNENDTRSELASAVRALPSSVIEARAKVAADREKELDALLALQAGRTFDAMKFWEQAIALCPHLTDDDIAMVFNCGSYIAAYPHLRAAIITGSETVTDSAGRASEIYTLDLALGSGGMGEIRVVAFLHDGIPLEAVVKLPLFNVLPTNKNDPEYSTQLDAAERDNRHREQMFFLEAHNARWYWQDSQGVVTAIPHVVTPYMVAHFLDRDTTGVVYEKILCPWGYVLPLDHMSFFDPKVVSSYPRIHVSKQLEALSFAFDGLAGIHARGLAHMDFKPGQVLVDEHGQGKVTDIGSFAEAHEVFELRVDSKSGLSLLYRQMLMDDGSVTSIGLPTTPEYYDTKLVVELNNAGKPNSLADRRAAGFTLLQTLEDNHFLAPKTRHNLLAAANSSPIAVILGSTYVLPDSLERLLQIAQELMDVHAEQQRPLDEIAAEIRMLKAQMAVELDPLFEQAYAGTGVVCVADF